MARETRSTRARTADAPPRIERGEIEAGLRRVAGEAEVRAKSGIRQMVPVIAGGSLLLLVIAYLIGRRVGTTKSTVVEIRRI
ncbi:MAG: hypothetical protein R2695_22285 [Acidimicrobiales bacterium]